MTNNTNIQQIKFSLEKKAIASLTFGIISISPLLLGMSLIFVGYMLSGSRPIYLYGEILGKLVSYALAPITSIVSFSSGIIGLTLGVKGLKSTKKKFALGGIILSIIGLAIFIIYFWIYRFSL